MRSASILDRATSETPQARDLLVLWQHPTTRQIIPIGRFVREGDIYAFSYTRAAASVPDFRPLLGMDDLRQRYEGTRLPAVFDQRVMEADRPDFAEYMESIGLDTEATPWEQIVESGGTRAGDTLQFMQVPAVVDGRARARFFASGVRHVAASKLSVGGREVEISSDEHELALSRLQVGDALLVEPEAGNPEDPCAALLTTGGTPVGWVPRTLSADFRRLLEYGPVTVTVRRKGRPGVPSHVRLVLDLDVPAPSGFQFDAEGSWEPIS